MISNLRTLILSATIKDTLVLFVGSLVSSVFAIIFIIILGRFLGPELLAIFVAAGSFMAIVNAFGDLGLSSSLFRFTSKYWQRKDTQKARQMTQTAFSMRFISVVVIVILLTIFSSPLSRAVYKTNQPILMVLSGIAVAGMLLVDFQTRLQQSRQKFLLSALILGSVNVLRVFLLVLLHQLGQLTLVAALFVYAASPLVVFAFSTMKQKLTFGLKRDWHDSVKEAVSFSGWMGGNRVVGSVTGRIDTLLLLQLLTPFQTGLFAAAKQLAMGVPVIIGSFATVLAPRFASLKRESLRKYLVKSIGLSTLISLGLATGIAVSPFVISLFGDIYEGSTRVLQLLLAGYIPFVLATPAVNLVVYAFGRPKVLTVTSIIQMPFAILGIIFLAPRSGIYAPVTVNLLVNLSTFIVAYTFAYKYLYRK